MSELDWECILQFDDESPAFAFGFQAGGIWERMKTRQPFEDQFCGEILELVQRMPSRCNYNFAITAQENGWYHLSATPMEDTNE
jgi:hypothetical protein